MADPIASYASDAIVFSMGGIPLEGFADGTHVSLDLDGEGTIVKRGNDGSVARAISPVKTATVTATFLQTASANIILYGLWTVDQVSKGQGAVPLLLEDLSGGLLFGSGSAWIMKPPKQDFSAGIENREWKITAAIADVSKFLSYLGA